LTGAAGAVGAQGRFRRSANRSRFGHFRTGMIRRLGSSRPIWWRIPVR
jgi:hypothetical protein